jgi:regulator of protease activity HflC (stomatin/prohibitin superfamily)
MKTKVALLLLFVCLVLFASGCGGAGYQTIPPTSVGIVFNGRTGISSEPMNPQLVWVGFYEDLIIYPTSANNANFNRPKSGDQPDTSLAASTSEGAILPVDVTVSYQVTADRAVSTFQTFGTADFQQIQDDYVRWSSIYALNVVSGRRSIFSLISKERATLGPEVKKVLSPLLAKWGISVVDVYVGEMYPAQEINNKVNESMTVRNELEKARIDKQRAITEAKTIITNAEKTAETNRLLAQQGDKALALRRLELRQLAIRRWNGGTPLVGDGKIPFTNLGR